MTCTDDNAASPNPNPRYSAEVAPGVLLDLHSKTLSTAVDGIADYGAVMVCSDADRKCPVVPGAALRLPIPYVDPKSSDATELERETYLARLDEIAADMFWVPAAVAAATAKDAT